MYFTIQACMGKKGGAARILSFFLLILYQVNPIAVSIIQRTQQQPCLTALAPGLSQQHSSKVSNPKGPNRSLHKPGRRQRELLNWTSLAHGCLTKQIILGIPVKYHRTQLPAKLQGSYGKAAVYCEVTAFLKTPNTTQWKREKEGDLGRTD